MAQIKKQVDKIEEKETKMIQKLRDYYRNNFRNGYSNESFLLWIEVQMEKGRVK
jgi:predicted DNA-binding protein (UPF0278 family)